MTVFVRVLSPILMILLGLAVGGLVSRLRNADWRLYGAGALTFIGSQVFHIPFNAKVLNPLLARLTDAPLQRPFLVVTAVALGLSAGLFEETSRYLVYRFGIKQARTWKDGLMFGAGHGGIEAILIGALSLLSVINIFVLSGRDVSTLIPAEQLPLAQQQIEAFWAAPWYGVLLGALERVFALCFHLSASVMVLQVFCRKNILWLFGAIGLHTLLDGLAVYSAQVWGAYVTEGFLALFAIVCVWIIFRLRETDMPEINPALQPVPLSQLKQIPVPPRVTQENIEDSKYV